MWVWSPVPASRHCSASAESLCHRDAKTPCAHLCTAEPCPQEGLACRISSRDAPLLVCHPRGGGAGQGLCCADAPGPRHNEKCGKMIRKGHVLRNY